MIDPVGFGSSKNNFQEQVIAAAKFPVNILSCDFYEHTQGCSEKLFSRIYNQNHWKVSYEVIVIYIKQ